MWASVAATLALSLANLVPRVKAEGANKAVGLAVETSSVESVAGVGTSLDDALDKLHAAGANCLVITEQTVGDLAAESRLTLHPIGPARVEVSGEFADLKRLTSALQALNPEAIEPWVGEGIPGSVTVQLDPTVLEQFSVGIDPEEVALANRHQMLIIARFSNRPEEADYLLDLSHELGAKYFLPLGDSVLGFKGGLDEIREKLKTDGMAYLSPEFVKMVGDTEMKLKSPENTIRLHSAQTSELSRMDRGAAVERYAKAFKERNIRMLLLRPQNPAANATEFADFVHSVKSGVIAEGGGVKEPRPFRDVEPSTLLSGLLGLAMIPSFVWVAMRMFEDRRLRMAAIVVAVLTGLLAFSGSMRHFAALGGSVGFVVLGYYWMLDNPKRNPVLQYLGVSFLSLIGGLQVAALLVGTKYMVQAVMFSGIKASVFLPILIVGLILLNLVKPLKETAKTPILWGTAVLSLVGLAVVAIMISRTGNDSPAGVSDTELMFRNFLDKVLPVRPRTKEFMIGHPAFVVGLGLWWQATKRGEVSAWAMACLAVSTIGQTSVVNTLCHLHTPLTLSLMRIVSGHIAGGIFGLACWVAVRAITERAPARGVTP